MNDLKWYQGGFWFMFGVAVGFGTLLITSVILVASFPDVFK